MKENYNFQETHKISLKAVFKLFLMIILLVQFPVLTELNPLIAQTQKQMVSLLGNVLDDTNEPAIGASVIVKGTTTGTITDLSGNFTISANVGSTVVISYIGYASQEIKVSAQAKKIFIKLQPDAKVLDEVVVQVGYSSVKRANLLGAVSDVATKDIQDVVTGNLSTALQGTMAGVQVSQASGAPGASTSIQIRIAGSWNNEAPLFVIDGFVRDQAAFDILDPSEVESVSILKDASAAVYGARSAGGVVLVTTKKGKQGKINVNYSSTYGISDATRFPELMSAHDHAVALNDITRDKYKWVSNDVLVTQLTKDDTYFSADELNQLRNIDYNWMDGAWKSAFQTRQNIGISGGTDKVRYYAGGSYMYQNGNFDNLSMNKYTMRLSMDVDVAKGWLLSLGLNGDNRKVSMPYNTLDKEPEKMYNTYSTLLRTPRWIPAYIDGLPVGQGGTILSHPLYINEINTYNRKYSGNLVGNIALQWDIPWIKGLKAKGTFDYTNGYGGGITYAKPYYLYDFVTLPSDYASPGNILTNVVESKIYKDNGEKYQQSANTNTSYQVNASIDYARQFDKHDLKALLVFEQSQTSGTEMSGSIEKMIIDNVEQSSAFGDGVVPVFTGKWSTPSARQSFIGRLNYNYDSRYLVEATFRYEASTKFSPADRWGFFPSVSLGWRVSEEPFFKENVNENIIDNLKFRSSFGRLGNDGANPLSWENNYLYSGSQYYMGGSSLLGYIYPNNEGLSMEGITWEKSDAYNVGFDTRFLKNISFAFDAFYRHNFDILQKRSSALSYSSGFGTNIPAENYGIQDSWGGEISLGYNGKIGRDWTYSFKGNISYATSKVIKKIQSAAIIGTWQDEEGRIRGGEVGYFSTGIMTQADVDNLAAEYGTYVDATTHETKLNYTILNEQPAAGMLNFRDVGGPGYSDTPDGKIDENDQRIISKYDNPPYHYGITMDFGWKDIKVSAIFSGQFGNDVVYDKAVYTTGEGNRSNFAWLNKTSNNLTMWNDHWTPENTDASMPKLYKGMADKRSTFWMRDGHSLALRSLQVSYQMPKKLSTLIGIPSLRLFFSGTNLWTIINPYPYKDAGLSSWMDYPIMRSFNMGVNINL